MTGSEQAVSGRIARRFASLQAQGRRALIPYVVAGHPVPHATVDLMHAMAAAGADIIELGVPFSDPMADGPVIQRATETALANGVRLVDVLADVRQFRQRDTATPVVLMGYLNPIERMGAARFALAARDAGVDGVLVVDLPPEESTELVPLLREQGIDPIFLLAPTSTPARIAAVAAAASSYKKGRKAKRSPAVTGSTSCSRPQPMPKPRMPCRCWLSRCGSSSRATAVIVI